MFTQGSFQSSSSETDLAIDGDGFFIVNDGNQNFYTRAGQFTFDEESRLVNSSGHILQGQLGDGLEGIVSAMTDLDFSPLISVAAHATGTARIVVNLESGSEEPAAWDIADPVNTSNFSTSLTVYDSIGEGHSLTINFRKTATAGEWEYHVLANPNEVVGGAGTEEGGGGTLQFDENGALDNETPTAGLTFDFIGATAGQEIAFDFGTSITGDSGTGLDGTTQFAAASTAVFQSQDGFAAGTLQSFSIDQSGRIMGNYSNGETILLGQILLARFSNPQGLSSTGNNFFQESGLSGQPIIGEPGVAGRGSVSSNSLELSNVDLGEQFVQLITTQRGFQASSRVITATDRLMDELVNLVR